LFVLQQFVRLGSTSIDVGANFGLYSYCLAKLSDRVEAFEPNGECLSVLQAYRCPRIHTHCVALSSAVGVVEMHVPIVGGIAFPGLASLRAPDGNSLRFRCLAARLDDFGFRDVSFIKIDVEGHEGEVLVGAEQTIVREHPILLVEVEQRHHDRPISEVFEWLAARDYAGHFLRGGRICTLEEFSVQSDQLDILAHRAKGKYVNNFIFIPAGRVGEIRKQMMSGK